MFVHLYHTIAAEFSLLNEHIFSAWLYLQLLSGNSLPLQFSQIDRNVSMALENEEIINNDKL